MRLCESLRKHKRFYSTVGSLHLGALCMGFAVGWPNTSYANLYENYGDPLLGYLDDGLAESVTKAGASIGSLLSIFIIDIFGRRMSFYASAAILVFFWIFLAVAGFDRIVSSRASLADIIPYQLIISAAGVAGVAVGIFAATSVLYVAEISSVKSRNIVGTAVLLSGYSGIFLMSVLGHVFDVRIVLSVMVIPPLSFIVAIHSWMIESPYYLFKKGMVLEAKISLMRLRDQRSVLAIDEEFRAMESYFNLNFVKKSKELLYESMCPKSLRPTTLIVIPIICISQLLGITVLSDYAENLIELVYPGMARLVTSSIDVLSIICCILALRKFGYKPLVAFTVIGTGLSCLILAIYHSLRKEDCHKVQPLTDSNALPVTMLLIYYSIYAIGFTPVLPIITGQIFPCRAKTAAVGICTGLVYLLYFVMQRFYKVLNDSNSCVSFATFTMLGAIGLPFAVAFLPDTKSNKTMQNEVDSFSIVNY